MKNINVLAPINSLGYGVAGLNMTAQLAQAGYRVALFPIGPSEVPAPYSPLIQDTVENAGGYDPSATSLRIYHQNQLAEHVGRGQRIGYTFFELVDLTPPERYHMQNIEKVFVASEWAAQVVKDNGVTTPVTVVPLGVDRTIFNEDVVRDRLEIDSTTFVNVGKWEVRKGHDILLSAFCKAFKRSDKVILKLATHNPFIGKRNAEWLHKYMTSSMSSRIQIQQDRLRGQGDVARLMASADCGVFPARGEAWNLDLLEAMSCGLHCIATNYSGHTEFVTPENCRLITVGDLEPASDGLWFHEQGRWASLGADQEEQLINHLREVHRLKQTGGLSPLNLHGVETAKKFSWEYAASKLIQGIES